jgi:filamentous hemagglutinin family protein
MAATILVRAVSSASLLALGTLLAWTPQSARAQGFAGTGAVTHGSATIDVSTPGTTNVNLPNTSERATITWTPTDTATGGGPIDFLPSGNIVNYTGDAGASGPYTVLNRIIPTDISRSVAFNGTVNSASNVRVFFYSPGGLLIGSTARFNVGGLLLSTSELNVDGSNDFMPVQGQFGVTGTAGSTSAIEIQAGAEIRAESVGQSNYVVAIAPRIKQDGLISARGSVALVAAESADFAVDSQGLFNITVNQGSEVSANTFSHTGSTGGPDAAGIGEFRRVYMVAVPKNNAISMAIESGGSIGFDVAGAASLVGNTIVLSAGHNIADTGTGDPIVATPAGIGSADITVSRGNYTSNTIVRSMTNATVADNVAAGNPNINFESDLSVRAASSAAVRADLGAVTIAGGVNVSADAPTNGIAGQAQLAAGGAGTSLTAGFATVSANNTNTNAPIAVGGIANVTTAGGSITIANTLDVSARAQGSDASAGGTGGTAFGGTVLISATNGGTITTTTGDIAAAAWAVGGAGGDLTGDLGGDAQGGGVRIETLGAGSAISAGLTINVDSGATAGSAGANNGTGGNATGGTAELLATDGNISVTSASGSGIKLVADAVGGNGGRGGNATGGNANVFAENATISTSGNYGLSVDTSAGGGDALTSLGDAGNAVGGFIDVKTVGAMGRIETNISGGAGGPFFNGIDLNASGTGGDASSAGSYGGNGTGGTVDLRITGAGQQIVNNSAMGTILNASATGGNAGTGIGEGGLATGGSAILDIAGGSFNATAGSVALFAGAASGAGDVDGAGTARGGQTRVRVDGTLTVAGDIAFAANGQASSGGAAASAYGGLASLVAEGGTISATNGANFEVNAFASSGTSAGDGDAVAGTAELTAVNGASIAFAGDVQFQTRALGGNTSGSSGGDAIGGTAMIRAKNADVAIATSTGNVTLANEAIGGMGDVQGLTSVTNALFETSGTGRIVLGGTMTGSAGDVTLAGNLLAPVNPLYVTLSAANNVAVNASVTNTSSGSSLVFRAGNAGSTSATVNFGGGVGIDLQGGGSVDIYHNPASFGTATDYSSNITSGTLTAYQLVHNATQMQSIGGFLNQSFALARNIDLGELASANGGTGFAPIGVDAGGNPIGGLGFTGKFDGQNFTIRNLFINNMVGNVGLFGWATGGSLRNIILSDGSVTSSGSNVGSLAGVIVNATVANAHSSVNVSTSAGGDIGGLIGHVEPGGIIMDSSASGTVINIGGPHSTGGLVGYHGGTILRSWATGNVTLDGSNRGVGGLVGFSDGVIDQSYATGSVLGGPNIHGVGGLVGYIRAGSVTRSYSVGDVNGATSVGGFVGYIEGSGSVSQSYASGAVVGTTDRGGFVGTNQGSISNSYWDEFTSGQSAGFGSDVGFITNLNAVTGDPAQSAAPNYAFDPESYLNFTEGNWTNFGGESRPIGIWEITKAEYGTYNVRSLHQLQFIRNDLAGNYKLAFDIKAFELQQGGTVLGGPGFIPIGNGVTPFTGTLDGAGHVVSNFYMNRPTAGNLGLFGTTNGTIRNLGLVNVQMIGGTNRVGAIAGTNDGLITGSFSTGTINGTGVATGGLVGENNNVGTITQSYSSVDVTGANTAGGLVGINAGTISFSFANGPVAGTNAGGLIGTNAVLATASNSYWDTQTSGRANACGTDDGTNCGAIGGLTTAQTQQSSSFVGWSIDTVGGQNNVWRMYNGASGPLLKAFLKPLLLSPGNTTQVYDTTVQVAPVLPVYANPSRIFGSPIPSSLNPNVGVYVVSYVGGLSSNQVGYDLIAGPSGTHTITPAPLTVTADPISRLYGDANPALTFNAVGLLGGDVLGGSLDTTATVFSGIGAYAITQGTLSNPNYAITYVGDTLTISPRPITVTADAANRPYGDANSPFTYTVGGAGLVNGDTLTGALSSLADNTSNVGIYAIDQGTLAASPNYTLAYTGADLSVVARAITITGDTIARQYGDANPALTYSVGGLGLVNGDTLSGSLATLADGLSNVGTYATTQGTLSASTNYALTYIDGAVNVTPRGITITADASLRTYGDVNPAFTYVVGGGGLVNGDTVTGALDSAATVTSNVGTYAITQGTVAASPNYAISYTGANLSVTPRALTVAADAASRLYGDANPALTYTATGLVNGDTLTGALDSSATVTSNVGAFVINQGTLDNTNYTISYTGANLNILVRPITVTGDTLARLYGDANPALTFTVGGAGLVNGDTLSGALATGANGASNVGGYATTQGTLAASTNYALTYVDGAVNVNARPLSVVVDAANRIYGDANPTFTYTATGLVNGDTLTGALDSLATVTSNVGTYSIDQASLAASPNYVLSYTGANLTVTVRPLSIVADAMSRIYGDANPAFTYTATGLVNGDIVTGALDSAATVTSNVGTYAITQGTVAASANYAISYTGANLSVTPRALSVAADAASRLYGDANPALTYTATGLVNGDTLAGALDTTANATSNVGAFAINQGTLDNTNYTISYTGANLNILVRPITVTGDTLVRLYGDANPALTFTVGGAGLVNGDTLTGALDTLANGTSNVGGYATTQGTLAASTNYALTYVDGAVNVNARPLSVVVDAANRIYGDANPTFTYTATGLVNGDTLTGALDSLATVTSNVGTYSIDQASLAASPNYVLSYTGANLTVTVRPLSIVADAMSRIYGDANPAFTYTATGLVNGDIVTGALDSAATVTSNVGTYAITQGTVAASANYAISYTGANLSVTPRALSVAADAASRLYGDANPALTYTATGLVNGDTLAGALDTTANATSNVGAFAINQGTLDNTNYTISYTGANLNILVRPITVTGDTLARLYGDANPALTFTVGGAGLVNGDTLSGALATVANGASNVGAYATTQGTLAASANYAVTFVDGALNITARPLSVVADAASRVYGDTNPTFTYAVVGLVNGDALTGGLDTAATTGSNVGSYAISQGTLAASGNYVVNYIGANLSVTPRPLSVVADAATRAVNEANPAFTFTANGLVNGDALTGSLSTTATSASSVGVYAIGQGTLAATANYSVSYTGANLTVIPCAVGAICAPPAAVMSVVTQIGTEIQQQDEEAEATEEAKKEASEASTADPKVMIQSVIDTSTFTQPLPVRDPVAGVGNSTIWIPGDSK